MRRLSRVADTLLALDRGSTVNAHNISPDEATFGEPGSFRIAPRDGGLAVIDGDIVARTSANGVRFAHLGCRCLKAVVDDRKRAQLHARKQGRPVPPDVPLAVIDTWTHKIPHWKTAGSKTAAENVGRALEAAMLASGARGLDLWDTMRRGSDYWRPGALLSDALAFTRQGTVEFFREEGLCPPATLLDAFRASEEFRMPFNEFAERYAEWLLEGERLDRAVRAVVWALARRRLAVFYCTDPFIPGYADGSEWARADVPIGDRAWPLASALPEGGCHRVVLADLLAQRLRALGCAGEVLEIDPTRRSAKTLPF